MFPFTDQVSIDGVEGMPERALRNTDKRIGEGKPVIPAFLFACMLWDPVKADAQVLMDDGTPEAQAWRIAMSDALRDQNQYVAVPKRLAEIILDIWNIHFRLIKRNPRMVKACLNNRRFRAAFDFLLLRTMVHEVDEDIGDWWGQIQTVEPAERDEMISEANKTYKQDRRPKREHNHNDDSAGGNDINYNSAEYNPGYDDNYGLVQNQTQNKGRANQNKPAHGRKKKTTDRRANGRRTSGQAADGQARKSNNGGRKRTTNPGVNRRRNQGAANNRPNRNGGGRARPSQQSDGRYQDAQPKDDYGNHSASDATQKKVKVRRKRRIVTDGVAAPKKPDDTPHF